MAWVDSATNDQRLSGMPNPVGYVWNENHPPQGPPGWDPILYWPWEYVRFLLTFLPARMCISCDRAVIIMYRTCDQPPPQANPLGLRPASLQRLMGWCCGPSRADTCPIGERLVGCCTHCATSLWFSAVIPMDPTAFTTTHHGTHLMDRRNHLQMDVETASEVS